MSCRVRIGVGHGVQDWMQQIGARVASPMTLLREYLTCLDGLLRGDRVTFDGRYVTLDSVRLDWPPQSEVELLAAATGPKTLALSGELATGTIITGGTDPDTLREACGHIETERGVRSTRTAHSVVVYVQAATGADARERARNELQKWGFDVDRVDDLSVHGSAADIADGLRRWADAGADTVVLQPATDIDLEDFMAFVGGEVKPLLADRG